MKNDDELNIEKGLKKKAGKVRYFIDNIEADTKTEKK